MKSYRTAGTILLAISLIGFAYVVVSILLYPDLVMVYKQTFVWLLLQCSASLVSGMLGAYLVGVYKGDQRHKTRGIQDSSVQE